MLQCNECKFKLKTQQAESIMIYGMPTQLPVPCLEYKNAKEKISTVWNKIVGCSNGQKKD